VALPAGPGSYYARHLLVLGEDVEFDEIETLAQSWFAAARWEVAPYGAEPTPPAAKVAPPGRPGCLRLTRSSTASGPFVPPSGMAPGMTMVFDVVCPKQREQPPAPGSGDRDGLGRAFGDGLPRAQEEQVVNWLVAASRRLGGSLVTNFTAPTETLLTPDPGAAIDLSLFSDAWLEPNTALALVAGVHPRVVLATEGVPWQGPPRGIADLALYPGDPMDPGFRRMLHAAADAVDIRALTTGQVLDGYGLAIDLGVDGMVVVEIGGEGQLPLLLRDLPWTAGGVVAYRVRWEPRDLVDWQRETPSMGLRVARKRASSVIAAIVRVLFAAVGGEIADESEFLVNPEDI
jgi:hypothetical protein